MAGPSWGALLREQRYRSSVLREDAKQQTLVLLAIALTSVVVVPNDLVLLEGRPGLLRVALAVRALFLVLGVAVLVSRGRALRPRQQDRVFHAALALTAILLSTHNVTRILVGRVQGAYIGCGSIVCAMYFAGRGPLVPRVIFCGVVSVAGAAMVLLPDARAGIDPPARFAALIALAAVNVVGVLSARSFEEQRRRRFEAEHRERRANRELAERLRELAIEKERAEAMSRARAAFLAAMSHEFRTPMNAVIGLSDIVLDQPDSPERVRHVRAINDSARALLGLLEDILDFAKIDAEALTLASAPFDLPRLATSVAEMLRPGAASRGVALSTRIAEEVPRYVMGDDARLRQVLVNLAGNAVKFTERGAVTLSLDARPRDGGDVEVTFRVEDSGIGMTPDVIARLFRPFEQGDAGHARRRGGTGLGLAISQRIVAAMGSTIHVQSTPAHGSTFTFTLPLSTATATAAAATSRERSERTPTLTEPRPSESAPADPERPRPPLAILVVDDHPLNLDVARAKIARLGYTVDLANDGPAAIAAAAAKDYDVVFMDLHMPGMGGIEATARLTAAVAGRRAPQVVAMTASVFEEDREACRRAGMRGFVGKPVDLAEIEALLARVAAERGAEAPVMVEPRAAPLSERPLDVLRGVEARGEARFFERVCRAFFAETRQRLARMRAALASASAGEMAMDAHALKSASAALGASAMSDACGRVEVMARAGQLDEAGPAIEAIEAQFAEAERALLREIDGEGAPSVRRTA